MKVWIVYLITINLTAFFMYGADKWKAKKHKWRISEKVLLMAAVLGGSVGALAGMYLFRHKTRHLKFVLGVPGILLFQIIFIFNLIQ